MALETVTLVLGSTWTLVSGAATGPFEAFSRSSDDVVYFIGDAQPAEDYEFGMPRRSLSFASLTAKVWAKSPQARSLVTILRTVAAGNALEVMLPKVTLSAATFSTALAAGARIATITNRIAGDRIDALYPNDGRIVLSSDGSDLIRGLSAVSAGTIEVEIVTSHPLAPNAPKRTKITVAVTAAVGVATAISIAKTADGSVGQTYTFTVTPPGAPIQVTRTTAGTSPVTTDIAGATAATYVAQAADANYTIGARAVGGSVSAKAYGRVLPAPINLMDGETTTGWSSGTYSRTVETAADAMQGAGGLLLATTDGGTTSPITTKTITDVVAPSDLGVLAFGVKLGQHSLSSIELTFKHPSTVAGLLLTQSLFPGRRIYAGRPYDFVSGTVAGGGFQRGDAGVTEPAMPTDVSSSVLQLRLTGSNPLKAAVRTDFIAGKAGGVSKYCLTFDDGYASALAPAFVDELIARGVKATYYPPADQINPAGDNMGDGKATTTLVIQAMRKGMLIGTNTRGDAPFTSYGDTAGAIAEFVAAKQALRDKLRTDPIWNEATDLPLLERGLDFVCLSNGLFQNATQKSSAVSATVTAGDLRVMRWTAAPATLPLVGATLDGWWPEAGQAKIASIATDNLSVTMDRDITAQTKSAVFLNEHLPFYGDKLPNAFRAAGAKLVRSTPYVSYPGNVSNNPRMHTRFGFADLDMRMPAQAPPADSTQAAFLQRAYKEGRHYECTTVFYIHGVLDDVTTIGINTRKSAILAMLDLAAPDIASGDAEFIDLLTLWRQDAGSAVPF